MVSASAQLILDGEQSTADESLSLVPFASVLQDKAGRLTLDDILSGEYHHQFVSYDKDVLDFQFTSAAYWLHAEIVNQAGNDDWYLNLWGPLSQNVQVYLGKGSHESFQHLSLLPKSRASKFHLRLSTGDKYQLYIRVQDKRAPLVIWPKLYSSSQMLGLVMMSYPLYSLIVGGLLALALYNLVSAISLRDKSFFALFVFILGYVLELGNLSGLLHFFTVTRVYLANQGGAFAFLIIASGLSLAVGLLDIEKSFPRLYKWYRISFWVSCAFIVLSFAIPFSVGISAVFGSGALILIFITLMMLRGAKMQLSPILQQAILLVIFGSIPAVMRGLGVVEYAPEYIDGLYVVLLIALILLSRSQAEQIQQVRGEAERVMATAKAKDDFLTTMSHELRTPMNAISGLGNLLKQTTMSEKQSEYVDRLGVASKHMLSLVDDILDLARIESRQLRIESKNFSLDAFLFQLEQLMKERIKEKDLKFIIQNDFFSSGRQLNGDATRLRQILLNLLDNAFKFTKEGQVKLTVTPEKIAADSVTLRFEVSDTGIGIPFKYQNLLFQPFTQVGEAHSGSGLGLAICNKIVQQMGGSLVLLSNPGEGSCFYFVLNFPLQVADKDSAIAECKDDSSRKGDGHLNILLVDDDEMNRFYGCELLLAMGLDVTTAQNGREADELLANNYFDLVLMDISMPVMDGYEATRKIREEHYGKGLKIVALTAHAIAGERDRCLQAGMDDYMTKPFSQQDLQQMLDKWFLLDR